MVLWLEAINSLMTGVTAIMRRCSNCSTRARSASWVREMDARSACLSFLNSLFIPKLGPILGRLRCESTVYASLSPPSPQMTPQSARLYYLRYTLQDQQNDEDL